MAVEAALVASYHVVKETAERFSSVGADRRRWALTLIPDGPLKHSATSSDANTNATSYAARNVKYFVWSNGQQPNSPRRSSSALYALALAWKYNSNRRALRAARAATIWLPSAPISAAAAATNAVQTGVSIRVAPMIHQWYGNSAADDKPKLGRINGRVVISLKCRLRTNNAPLPLVVSSPTNMSLGGG